MTKSARRRSGWRRSYWRASRVKRLSSLPRIGRMYGPRRSLRLRRVAKLADGVAIIRVLHAQHDWWGAHGVIEEFRWNGRSPGRPRRRAAKRTARAGRARGGFAEGSRSR